MKKNPLNKGVLTENFKGIGPVTREMVHARAGELALIAGHKQISQTDYEQAKRELTGESDVDLQNAVLDSLPESMRAWDAAPGSGGRQAPESPDEEEDDEGRSETQQLVEEGVEEAEHDQMLQAARAAQKRDQREP